jgi:Na+-transporting NADH:ubiquinone oxidoreductase subunit C
MKYRIWTVVFLVIVVCISTGMLSAVYVYTDPMVRMNEKLKTQRGVLEVFRVPYEESAIEAEFGENIDTQTIEDMVLYRSKTGGVAFEVSGPGFWGEIRALIALEPDLDTIKGLKILENTETPGVGGRIGEDWFQDQFSGKKLTPELRIVPHGKATTHNEVDAITGATQTSRAFEKIINSSVKAFHQKMKR